MNFKPKKPRSSPSLDITPLIDVVFLLLVFLLLTMTFTQDKTEVEETIIDIELAKSSHTESRIPPETVTLLIDEAGSLYQSDAPTRRTPEEIKLYLSEQLLAHPDISVNIKADHRTKHGDVVRALDIVKSLGIQRVQLIIEKQAQK